MGPRLRVLLHVVLALFALLTINSLYLVTITVVESLTAKTIQNYFYQYMFLAHLVLGLLILVPVLVFGALHIRNARGRRNRRAVRAGYALFAVCIVLLGSGIALTRIEGWIEIKSPAVRDATYWAHVACPLVVVWLFVLHRLAGPRIRWRNGLTLAGVGLVFALLMAGLHSQDPRRWNVSGPASGARYFFPSLARTATGGFIPARSLMMDHYCVRCHEDAHRGWAHSVHRFSSFNNPAYLFSVRETREAMLERDGNVQGSRFCAGCHDPVPFFSGAFDDPSFDDVRHPTAQAGITCTSCHAITHVNSVRGNADYTIEEPAHYPFAFSDSPFLQWVNQLLVKAKPAFHKKTFLKPLHQTAEFCGACHKVHLPEELNGYKWLRGQNHYDSFRLSGVSGHGISSFYYPKEAEKSCNGCHMPLEESTDFGARYFDGSGKLKIHGHMFPSANTGIAHLLDLPDWVQAKHREFNEGVVRVDVFGVKKGGTIDGELAAPLRPARIELEPGRTYLVETVIRTLKLGHLLTEGTADSNELWLDVTARSGGRVIGRSGGRRADGAVDPWSHFVNAYVLDRDGNRIDRRNAQDIFVPLYNHQIPPGAGDVVHYKLVVPDDAGPTVTLEVALRYRKFDTTYMNKVRGREGVNDLPVLTLAADEVTLPVAGHRAALAPQTSPIPEWQRWNDYGIGLLRKGGTSRGELRQAEAAFARVEQLGRSAGALNRGRVYVKEGRLAEAVAALRLAGSMAEPAPPWSLAWFTALVDQQNGHLDAAIENLTRIVETRFEDARARGFDFSRDDRVRTMLGQTLFERALQERGAERAGARNALLKRAEREFLAALDLDPESTAAHWGLVQVYTRLREDAKAAHHRGLHARYRPDDNARDRVIALHRSRNPAADHAAEAIVIYDLHRPDAYDR